MRKTEVQKIASHLVRQWLILRARPVDTGQKSQVKSDRGATTCKTNLNMEAFPFASGQAD